MARPGVPPGGWSQVITSPPVLSFLVWEGFFCVLNGNPYYKKAPKTDNLEILRVMQERLLIENDAHRGRFIAQKGKELGPGEEVRVACCLASLGLGYKGASPDPIEI
jgi:hypothetical protein